MPSSGMRSNLPAASRKMYDLPQALIFDLDDTLISDDALTERSWRYVCAVFAQELGVGAEELYRLLREFTGNYWADSDNHRRGRQDLYRTRRDIVAEALRQNGLGSAEIGYRLADSYSAEKERLMELLPGALEVLVLARQKQVRLALLTNGGSQMQRSKIERFNLAGYFDYIQIEGELGIGKPETQAFQNCLKALDAGAEASWMIGDDLKRDIGGAAQAGIKGVWVDWRNKGLAPGSQTEPFLIIQNITELKCHLPLGK